MSAPSQLQELASAVFEGDRERARKAAEAAIASGLPPMSVLNDGLVVAMRTIGEKWKAQEIFLPEVLMAVEAWKASMAVIGPKLSAENRAEARRGVVVIGTVKGDIHEIGKNIVAALLSTAGFEVHDLGTDLPASVFVTEAERLGADIIASSALMTTTMPHQRDVVEYLETKGKRNDFYYLIGGAPVSPEWAQEIGADAYGKTAEDAVRVALDFAKTRRTTKP